MARRKTTSKLNANTAALLCEAVRLGLTQKSDIARFAGISSGTLREWEKVAEDPTAPNHVAAKRIIQALQLERTKLKLRLLDGMETAGKNDWRMWAQKLKWLDPAEYGDRASVELSGKVQTEDVSLTDEERVSQIIRIFDAVRARASASADGGSESVATDGTT